MYDQRRDLIGRDLKLEVLRGRNGFQVSENNEGADSGSEELTIFVVPTSLQHKIFTGNESLKKICKLP